VRKKFTDETPYDPLFLRTSLFGNAEVEYEEENPFKAAETHGTVLYNEVMASHYEVRNLLYFCVKGIRNLM